MQRGMRAGASPHCHNGDSRVGDAGECISAVSESSATDVVRVEKRRRTLGSFQ